MIKNTGIKGLFLFQPTIYQDDRGYFLETFNKKHWIEEGIDISWVQDNESSSMYGVLRGMHYQRGGNAQTKLVRVVSGKVLDVAIDLRPSSPTYGQHFSEILSAENKWQMFIPIGFAHGFLVLSETATFCYKCDNFYDKESEGSINPLDPILNIDWIIPPDKIILSEKDRNAPQFGQHKTVEL